MLQRGGAKAAAAVDGAPKSKPRASTLPEAAKRAQQRAAASVQVSGGKASIRPKKTTEEKKPAKPAQPAQFIPRQPRDWDELGLDPHSCMYLVMRTMLSKGSTSAKNLAKETGLAWPLVREIMDHLKNDKLVRYRSTTALGDFVSELAEAGLDKAMQSRQITQYVGPAPVLWDHYVNAVRQQSLSQYEPREEDLRKAFKDIYISDDMLERLGPAVTSCQPAMLL